jgi:hypothetical protein
MKGNFEVSMAYLVTISFPNVANRHKKLQWNVHSSYHPKAGLMSHEYHETEAE